jgi:hypothetical protein
MRLPGILTRVLGENAQTYYKEAMPRRNGSFLAKTSSERAFNRPSPSKNRSDKPILPPGMTWGMNGSIIEVPKRENSISSEEDPSPVPSKTDPIPLGLQRTPTSENPGNLSSNSLGITTFPKIPKKNEFPPLPSRMVGGKRKTRKQRKQRSRKNRQSRKNR